MKTQQHSVTQPQFAVDSQLLQVGKKLCMHFWVTFMCLLSPISSFIYLHTKDQGQILLNTSHIYTVHAAKTLTFSVVASPGSIDPNKPWRMSHTPCITTMKSPQPRTWKMLLLQRIIHWNKTEGVAMLVEWRSVFLMTRGLNRAKRRR